MRRSEILSHIEFSGLLLKPLILDRDLAMSAACCDLPLVLNKWLAKDELLLIAVEPLDFAKHPDLLKAQYVKYFKEDIKSFAIAKVSAHLVSEVDGVMTRQSEVEVLEYFMAGEEFSVSDIDEARRLLHSGRRSLKSTLLKVFSRGQ